MKRIIVYGIAAMLFASCSQIENIEETKLMTFNVGGEFTKSYEEMSRASVSDAGMTDIWVFEVEF